LSLAHNRRIAPSRQRLFAALRQRLTALPGVAYPRTNEMNDIGVPMSDSALNSATSLERAFERLARAVDHLEHAIEAASDRPAPENGGDLEAARSESAQLRETHELAAEQLNSTIARLRGVLGG
jgi:hypothetical protein